MDLEVIRERILDAAESEFCARGFRESSCDEVASRAGVTRTLLDSLFESKRQLWGEVSNRRFAEYFEIQSEIMGRAEMPQTNMTDSLTALFRFFQRNPEFVRMHRWALIEEPGLGEPDAGKALTRHGIDLLSAARDARFIRADLDPASILAVFFAVIENWFLAQPDYAGRFAEELPRGDVYLDTVIKVLVPALLPPHAGDDDLDRD